jgi:hypothetical protein
MTHHLHHYQNLLKQKYPELCYTPHQYHRQNFLNHQLENLHLLHRQRKKLFGL